MVYIIMSVVWWCPWQQTTAVVAVIFIILAVAP